MPIQLRLTNPVVCEGLEREQQRTTEKAITHTVERLLMERLMQVECFTDKNFMDVFGDKIAERKWIREQVEKNTATERKQIQEKIDKGISAAVVTRTNELMAEVAELKKKNEALMAEVAAGTAARVAKLEQELEKANEELWTLEADIANGKYKLAMIDTRTADEIEHDMEMQSRKEAPAHAAREGLGSEGGGNKRT
jgi:hypothetical protein